MLKTDFVRARIEPTLKREAETILSSIGLSVTDTVTLLYKQVVFNRGLPFSLNIPNEETLAAFAEINDKSKSLTQFDTAEEMMDVLWK